DCASAGEMWVGGATWRLFCHLEMGPGSGRGDTECVASLCISTAQQPATGENVLHHRGQRLRGVDADAGGLVAAVAVELAGEGAFLGMGTPFVDPTFEAPLN